MIVQFRNEKVSNHGSIPITIDCNVVVFIVFEEGFHQPIKRTKQSVFLDVTVFRHNLWISFIPIAAVLFVDVAIQPEVRFIAKQNSLMKIGNNGNLVLGPFDESTLCLMIVLMNCLIKLRINHLTAVKSVAILEICTSCSCNERKLDEAGASEINRLYPESRRKDEKRDRYLNSLPPQGEAGGRERPNEDETGVTSRREGKSAGREGAPKRVRGAPKTQWEGECCFFFATGMERKESVRKTYRRYSRWNEAGASFNTDPSSVGTLAYSGYGGACGWRVMSSNPNAIEGATCRRVMRVKSEIRISPVGLV
ncbi:hypothetical protein TNCV_4253211 [Trichonephila clavipes]|nr:hypothetical protein TNCV_4253211 [Trichonephila clavipes]